MICARRLGLLFILICAPSRSAVIATNIPATPLTANRVAGLPAWKAYYEHSQRQRQADRDFLLAELKTHDLKKSTLPPKTHSAKGLSLDNEASWYAGAAAQRIADILVSFQTPAGGWSKNTDFTLRKRLPGELFGAENGSLWLGTNDFDTPLEDSWNYVGTFDNNATTTELRVGGSSKGESCASSKGEILQRIKSQDFGPDILGWEGRLGHGPKLAKGMIDEGDG